MGENINCMTECHIYLLIYFSLQSHIQNNDFELMFIIIPIYAKIGNVKFIINYSDIFWC